jgi:predicted transcriptional regulator
MRRSRMDIVVDVLEVAKNGVNKTAIVYRTNLNFTLAEKYLELLEKQGLLENKSDKYITSDKGKVFLAKAKEITMQLETPLHNPKEETMQNEAPLPKGKQTTLQYEAPILKAQEMTLQQNIQIERLREISIQLENTN